jgi:hypothetical protein
MPTRELSHAAARQAFAALLSFSLLSTPAYPSKLPLAAVAERSAVHNLRASFAPRAVPHLSLYFLARTPASPALLSAASAPAKPQEQAPAATSPQISLADNGNPIAAANVALVLANMNKVSLGTTDDQGKTSPALDLANANPGNPALNLANLGKVPLHAEVDECSDGNKQVYLVGPGGKLPPPGRNCTRKILSGTFFWGQTSRVLLDVARGTLLTGGATAPKTGQQSAEHQTQQQQQNTQTLNQTQQTDQTQPQPAPTSQTGQSTSLTTTGSTQNQAGPQTGATPQQPAYATNPRTAAVIPQIQDLALHQAVEQFLHNLTQNISGPWVDPNGNAVGLATAEGLALTQYVTLKQLQIAKNNASPLLNLTADQKLTMLANLRNQSVPVKEKYDAYQALQRQLEDVPGTSVAGIRDQYYKFMNQVSVLQSQGRNAEAQDLLDNINGSLYGRFVAARNRFYQALGVNPLLGVRLTTSGPHFFEVVLQNTSVEQLSQAFDQYAGAYSNQLQEQIDRISQMRTIAELWELGGPQYAATRAIAAGYGSDFTKGMIAALEATYAGTKAVGDYEKGMLDFVMAIGQAIPVAGLAFTAIQIYREGSDYVVALSDEKNAQAMATVTGYQGVIQTYERRDSAGNKLLISVAMLPAQIPGLMQALSTGKNLVVKLRGGAAAANAATETGTAASAANETATALNGGTATTGTAIGSEAAGLTNDANVGLQKARQMGLTDTDRLVAMINDANKDPLSALAAEAQLDNVGNVDKAVAAARAAGVPADKINAILSNARKANTVGAYSGVPRELALAQFEQEGNVIITNADSLEEAANQFGGANIKVLTTENINDLLSLKTKMSLAAREARLPQLTANELAILRNQIVPQGDKILKWFSFDGQTLSVEAIFDKQFIQELRTALKQSADAGNRTAAQLLSDLDWNAMEAEAVPAAGAATPAPSSSPAPNATPGANAGASSANSAAGPPLQRNANGQVDWIKLQSNQVSQLTAKDLRAMPKQVYDLLPPETQQAIGRQFAAVDMPPRAGMGPTQGNLTVDPQKIQDFVNSRNADQLKTLQAQLAKNPAADPTLKNAVDQRLNQFGGGTGSNSANAVNGQNAASPANPNNPVNGVGAGAAAQGTANANNSNSRNANANNSSANNSNTNNNVAQAGGANAPNGGSAPNSGGTLGAAPQAPCAEAEGGCAAEEEAYNNAADAYRDAAGALEDAVARVQQTGAELTAAGEAAQTAQSTLPTGSPAIAAAQARLAAAKSADDAAVNQQTLLAQKKQEAYTHAEEAEAKLNACLAKAKAKCAPPQQATVQPGNTVGQNGTGNTPRPNTPQNPPGGNTTGGNGGSNTPGGATPGTSPGGANAVGGTAPQAALTCIHSSDDCAELGRIAAETAIAAAQAQRDLEQVPGWISEADALAAEARSLHDQATHSYSIAAGYAQIGNTAEASAARAQAKQYDTDGDAKMAQSQALRAKADGAQGVADALAARAKAAWAAYYACLNLPPCPEQSANTTNGGNSVGGGTPVNVAGGAPATPPGNFSNCPRAQDELNQAHYWQQQAAVDQAKLQQAIAAQDSSAITFLQNSVAQDLSNAQNHFNQAAYELERCKNQPPTQTAENQPTETTPNNPAAPNPAGGATPAPTPAPSPTPTPTPTQTPEPPPAAGSTSACMGGDTCTDPTNCVNSSCMNVANICTNGNPVCAPANGPADSPFQVMMTAGPIAPKKSSLHRRDDSASRYVYASYRVPPGATLAVPPEILAAQDASGAADGKNTDVSLVSTGVSSGEAFQLQVRDPSGQVKQVALPEGVVMEPVKPGAAKPAASKGTAGLLTQQVGAFCLQFAKLPPEAGMVYRIASPLMQNKFADLRLVLQAGRKLAEDGKLHPDSEPNAYADSIRQYAVWSQQEGWDQNQFADNFVERTKKNAELKNVQWTPQIEAALRAAVPGRWSDITQVLSLAHAWKAMTGKSQTQPSGGN